MSSFTEPLILEALSTERKGQGEFAVFKEFHYEIGYLGSGDKVTVPIGYNTDLCSLPRMIRMFIPISGRMAKPALIHDWLFENEDPRASSVFREALEVNQVGKFQRTIMFWAVSYWAWWKRFRKRLIFWI